MKSDFTPSTNCSFLFCFTLRMIPCAITHMLYIALAQAKYIGIPTLELFLLSNCTCEFEIVVPREVFQEIQYNMFSAKKKKKIYHAVTHTHATSSSLHTTCKFLAPRQFTHTHANVCFGEQLSQICD